MSRVRGSLTVARPVDEVFDTLADQRNEPRYNPRMTSCVMVTDGPVGVGSTFQATMRSRPQPFPVTIEYTRFLRPSLIASRSRMPGAVVEGQLRCEPTGDGTRLSWDWTITTTGVMRLAGPLITVIGRRQERAIWSGLKRLLEDGPDEHQTTDSVDPKDAS